MKNANEKLLVAIDKKFKKAHVREVRTTCSYGVADSKLHVSKYGIIFQYTQ